MMMFNLSCNRASLLVALSFGSFLLKRPLSFVLGFEIMVMCEPYLWLICPWSCVNLILGFFLSLFHVDSSSTGLCPTEFISITPVLFYHE